MDEAALKVFRFLLLSLLVLAHATSTGAAPIFPVKYSTDRRYLVDQRNVPFPIMGRTAWFVLSLKPAEYRVFVDDTAARGYSAIELHVLNHDSRGNHPPFNGNWDAPFRKRLNGMRWNGSLRYGNINAVGPDFTSPNEAYWRFVDEFLAYCESKGILVFLFPAYVGFRGSAEGWMREMVANGPAKMHDYGVWIATRYRDQKNIIWMLGGDMGTPPFTFTNAQTDVESALLAGLKSVTRQQSTLFSAEWTRGSIATDQLAFGDAMSLNGVYAGASNVNDLGRRAYSRVPTIPAFLLEEPYDEEGPDGNNVNTNATQPVRRFQWWGWLSTIGGYVSGNGYVWPFNSSWKAHLNTRGTRDMSRLNAFMRSVAWYDLVPSGLNGMRTLVTSGGSSVSAEDDVAAAATRNGTLLVAYLPPARSGSITVDMAAMARPARGRWFDPTNGLYVEIGRNLPNSGLRSFVSPGDNSANQRDWVLVLD